MSLTLSDANLLSLPMMTQGVIDTIVRESRILAALPFQDVVGSSYIYNQELTLSTADFYAPNDSWNEATLTVQQKVALLKILGGNVDVDSFLERTHANVNDLRAVAVQNKAKAVAYAFEDTFINGDISVDNNSFDGLARLVDPAQVISVGTGNGGQLTLDYMDQLVDAVKPGKPDLLVLSKRSRRKMMSLLRGSGNLYETDVNNFGQRIEYYSGIAIAPDDFVPDNETLGSSSDCSSIYALKLGDFGVLGLTNGGIITEQVGSLPDKDAWRVRIKFYCGLAAKAKYGLARLNGIRA
jgi:hypothetical protein